jgi:DnaK suppressor protein
VVAAGNPIERLASPLQFLGREFAVALLPRQTNIKEARVSEMSVTSDMTLTSNMLLLLKSDLQKQQRELTRAMDRTQKEMRALVDSDPGDVIDISCGNSCKEAVFSSYSLSRTQLHKVESALERIASGDFGICAACGGPIGLKRLQALPWVTNCIECQEQSEQARVH